MLAAALAWAQEFKPCEQLPKGVRQGSFTCPLSVATGLQVGATFAVSYAWNRPTRIDFPPLVGEFVRRFDAGEFPHLDADQPVG